jgi:predicted O-methyltransferase YrrM
VGLSFGSSPKPPNGNAALYASIEAILRQQEPGFRRLLQNLGALPSKLAPARWDQDWFPRLDAAMAYALVRDRRPGRIVEIGSGHSTRFMAAAIANTGLTTKLVSIDPKPRADIKATGATWIGKTVQDCGEAPFAALAAGDILFIDSSHVMRPDSDVDFLHARILPRLARGTLVHIHDIFLPDDYPAAWSWRKYNEQVAVAGLLGSLNWRAVFASHYALTRMTAAVEASAVAALPLVPGAIESSLWLERIG